MDKETWVSAKENIRTTCSMYTDVYYEKQGKIKYENLINNWIVICIVWLLWWKRLYGKWKL